MTYSITRANNQPRYPNHPSRNQQGPKYVILLKQRKYSLYNRSSFYFSLVSVRYRCFLFCLSQAPSSEILPCSLMDVVDPVQSTSRSEHGKSFEQPGHSC